MVQVPIPTLKNIQLQCSGGFDVDRLRPQVHLLLVHWTADRGILSLTGDEVHEDFLRLVPDKLKRIKSLTEDNFYWVKFYGLKKEAWEPLHPVLFIVGEAAPVE